MAADSAQPLPAGPALSAGRDLGRQRSQFRLVLGPCREGQALPLRSGRPARAGAPDLAGIYRPGVAWLSAGGRAGHALRLSRLRALRSARTATASILTSCCSIPMPNAWRAVLGRCDLRLSSRLGREDLSFDRRDSARAMPKCRVVAIPPTAGAMSAVPQVPPADTIIYETHLRGFTMRLPDMAEPLERGSFAGLAPRRHRLSAEPRDHRRSSCCRSSPS